MIRFGECFGRSVSGVRFYAKPRRFLSLVLAATLVLNGPFGVLVSARAQIVSDPRAPIQFQPRVGAAPNGVPLIDITKPSFGGVSHNKFDRYNVDTRGVILNNSGLGGTSILGGQVAGNPNLVGARPASVILNEVTGTSASLLNGPTEVFGAKAEVIVANPNGVTCRSCSFINTGRVTLATGVPVPDYQNGTVGFHVTRGMVRIEGGGVASIDAEGRVGRIGDLDLVGRQIAIDAPINSSGHVRMRSGAINWNQNTDAASRLTGADVAAVGGPAIASSASGVIQAGTISAISYDVDLGVSFKGDMVALGVEQDMKDDKGQPLKDETGRTRTIWTGSLVAIGSAGDLSVGTVKSDRGDIRLEADGALTVLKDNQAVGRITGFGRTITVETEARLLANDAIVLEAVQDLVTRGYLQSGSAISLVGGGNAVASGRIIAGGMINLEGANVATEDLQMSGSSLTVAGLGGVALERTALVAKDDIAVLGSDVRLGAGTAFQAGDKQDGRILVDARGTLTNATVLNYPNLKLNLGRSLVNEASGQIVFDELRFVVSESIVNAGLIYGRIGTWLESQTLENRDGGTIYGPEVTVSVSQTIVNVGKILSEGKLAVTALGAVTNRGAIQANGAITLQSASYRANSAQAILAGAKADIIVSGALNNAGRILVDDLLTVAAGSLNNQAGGRIAGYDAAFLLSGNATNAGSIEALNLLNLSAVALTNSGSLLAYEISKADGNNLVAGLELSGKLDNSGTLQAANNLLLTSKSLQNGAGAVLQAQSLSAIVSNALTNSGTILADGILILEANNLTNSGSVTNTATISGKYLQATIGKNIANGGYGVIQGTQSTVIKAQTATLDLFQVNDLSSGIFNYGKDLALTLSKQGLTIDAGRSLVVDGSLYLSLGGDVSVYGTLASRDDLSLNVKGSVTVGLNDPDNPGGGEIFTRGNAEIIASGNISNYASVIQSLGSMYIETGGTLTNTRTAQRSWLSGVYNPSLEIIKRNGNRPEKYTDYHTTFIETSGAAQIWSGGDLVISGRKVVNDASTIFAGNILKISARTVQNLTRDTGVYYKTVKEGGSTNIGKIFYQGWVDGAHEESTAVLTGGAGFDASGIETFRNEGLIQSPVIRIDAKTLVNGITDPNRVTAPSRLPDPVIDLGSYFNTPGSSNPVVIDGVKYLKGSPVAGDSGQRGPGWILEQVGDIREGLVFYADPTTEQRALIQASIDKTGSAYLDPKYRTPAEQQEALWQATVDFLKSNPDIRLGDALTAEQRAKLTEPILWYVSQVIDGEPVLVPQLLLPEDRLEEWRKSNGGVMMADDITLSGDSIHNTGALLAENSLSITADTFTNERRVASDGIQHGYAHYAVQDGGFIAANIVQVKTTGDLINIGGTIIADSAMNLVAGGNLILTASVVENESHDGSKGHSVDYYERLNYGGTVYSGGDISLYAGNDLRVEGSSVIALGDASLLAGGNITVTSVMDEMSLEQSGKKGNFLSSKSWHSSDQTETNVSSLIMAGGNLTVAAAGDVNIHASDLVAGNDMLVAAGAGANGRADASVTITAGQDSESHTYSQTKSGLFGGGGGWFDIWYKKNTTTENVTVTNVSSSLTAGGDITITAKNDIAIQGSLISAGGMASLDAGHDITITPGYDGSGDYYKTSQKGVGLGFSSGDGSAKAQFGYHSSKTETTLDIATVAPSVIQGGAGVVMNAGNDINLQAAIIASPGDITLSAGHDINVGVAYNTSSMTAKHDEKFFGITAKVSQNVSGAISQLQQAADTFKSGHGSTAYEVIGMASGIMQGTDALMSLTNPTVSGSIMIGGNGKQTSMYEMGAQAVPSQIVAGGDITLSAGNNIHLIGTQVHAGNDMMLVSSNDIIIESAQSYASSGSKEQSWNAGIGIGASVGLSSGSAGFRIEGSISKSENESWAIIQNNAHLVAGNGIFIVSDHNTVIAGAVIKAPEVTIVAGNDLTIQSRQDMTHAEGSSLSAGASAQIGFGATGSINAGIGSSTSDKVWVTEQTSIYADGKLDIWTGNHTQINGAVINSGSGDLTLDTGTLGFTNIQDHDKGSSYQVNVGISNDASTGKPTGATVSGSVSEYDREQVNRATVGEGDIIIRNEDEQKQDVAALNRDEDKAQEITKDESSGVDFYVSSSAIQEIGSGFSTIQKNLDNLAKADQTIPQNIKNAAKEADYVLEKIRDTIIDSFAASGEISASSAAKLKEISRRLNDIDPDTLQGACGSQQGFNLWHLIITPAYARDEGCLLRFRNGQSINMSDEEYAKLKQSVVLSAQEKIKEDMPKYDALLAKQEAGTLTPSEAAELQRLHGSLQKQMAYYELCSDSSGGLRSSGLIPDNNRFTTMISVAEAYRAGGDAIAAEKFDLTKDQAEKLMALRKDNPELYFASYQIIYGNNGNLLDALFLMDGANKPGVVAATSQEMLKLAAGQIAAATLPYDSTVLSSLPPGISDAIRLASNDLSTEQRFNLALEYYQYQIQHSNDIEDSVSRARKSSGTLLVMLGVASVVVPVTEAALVCLSNPLCRAEAVYTLGNEALAAATGEGAVAVGGISIGVKNGSKVIDALEQAAHNKGLTNFVTDSAHNTLDLASFKKLTQTQVEVTGARGGVQYPLQGQAANSYANLGNGHAVVYGPDGRALYDISEARIKVIEWHLAPNGQFFPKKSNDTKAFQGSVPESILKDLGLK